MPIERIAQGDRVFGVYLAIAEGETGDDATRGAERRARRMGWAFASGDLACDRGAHEALALEETDAYFRVAVYFATRAAAERFAAIHQNAPKRVAVIEAFCRD